MDVASDLQTQARAHSKSLHWLCELLANIADTIDPASVADAFGETFVGVLREYGAPKWVADVAGWGVSKAAEGLLKHVIPGAQLCLGLRVLGLQVCPDLDSCPAQAKLSMPLIRAAIQLPA